MIASATSAQAADLATILIKEGTSTKLAVYTAECGLEGYHECVKADFGCSTPGAFRVSMFSYTGKEAGALLAKDDAKGSISFAGQRILLHTESLQFEDMDSDWSVALRLADVSFNIWKAAAKSGTISITLGKKTVIVPQTPAAQKDLSGLLRGCTEKK